LKLKIGQEDSKIEKEKNNIVRVNDKVKQLKQKEIDDQKSKLIVINNEIEKIGNELEVAIADKKRELLDEEKTKVFSSKELQTALNNIKEKGLDKKTQIKELEESKVCPTCNRDYDDDHKEHIDLKVKELNDEISELLKTGKATQTKLKNIKSEIDALRVLVDDLETGNYGADISEVQKSVEKRLSEKKAEIELVDTVCEEIKDGDYSNVPELESNINKGLMIKTKSEKTIKTIEDGIKSIRQEIKDKGVEKSDTQDQVSEIEKVKTEVKTYDRLRQENKELSLKIDNIKLTIENAKTKIDKYYEQLKYIDDNKTINDSIVVLDVEINDLEREKEDANDRLANIMKEASVTKDTIKDIQNNIKKYLVQVKQDELLKEYQKCVHRDGIPTFLLQKSKDLINVELEDMLTNVDFNVFFDEHLNLKMYNKDFPHAIQNLLECSGAERTFGATALKMALRTINNNSRPNIFLMDEVMLKLKNKSVDEFNDMLLAMKNKIDKIIIIEHVHTVPFDVLIEIEKNKKGISSLTIT